MSKVFAPKLTATVELAAILMSNNGLCVERSVQRINDQGHKLSTIFQHSMDYKSALLIPGFLD
jgi:hypothetical protein